MFMLFMALKSIPNVFQKVCLEIKANKVIQAKKVNLDSLERQAQLDLEDCRGQEVTKEASALLVFQVSNSVLL